MPLTIVRGIFAVRKGLEHSTSGVTGRHSNQLNYRTSIGCFLNADAKLSIFSESAIARLNFFHFFRKFVVYV